MVLNVIAKSEIYFISDSRRNSMFKDNNIKTPQELMQYFNNNFKYGFIHRNKIFTDDEPDFQENMDKFYRIRLGKDFIKHKYGVCWDFCELERLCLLEYDLKHECYFIESHTDDEKNGPTHTFVLYTENNKWYWFEFSWFCYRGIWQYNTKSDALKDILLKFKNFFDNNLVNINIYKTTKVTKRLNTFEFINHCLKGQKIESFCEV